MPMMRRENTIESYWKEGAEIAKLCLGKTYGKSVLKKLATERNVSYETLNFKRQLAERLSLKQVRAADDAGMPWNTAVPLINYGPSPKELQLAKQDRTLDRALTKRTAMFSEFISRFANKELRGTAFIAAVKQWRADNIDLWSPGKQRRCMFDHAVRATSKLEASVSATAAYQAALQKRMMDGDESKQEKVAKALSLLREARALLVSA